MNIAMISLYLPSDSKIGSGYQAHYMANALTRRGHTVTMFSPCGASEGSLYETVVVDPGKRFRTFAFALKLRSIDYSHFDLVHAHGDDYWLWSRRRYPAHVRTMHGSCLAEALHIPGLPGKLRMLMLGLSEILATIVADRTVCVSRNTTRYYPYPWVRDVIMNGVDTTAFRPAEAGSKDFGAATGCTEQKESRPTVLFVGTYHNRKRGKLLMGEFEAVIRPALPNAQLWMVCEQAPEAGGVTVFSRIPLEQLTDLYRRAWVFCLPSSYEGFGVPYIEAMASGLPVVATPNPGSIEVLDKGRFGIIAEPANLGNTILELLQNAAERSRLTSMGLERVQAFAWDHIVDQYEVVYNAVLAKRGRAVAPTSS